MDRRPRLRRQAEPPCTPETFAGCLRHYPGGFSHLPPDFPWTHTILRKPPILGRLSKSLDSGVKGKTSNLHRQLAAVISTVAS